MERSAVREEWMEEMEAHCERCCEASQTQEGRTQEQRQGGDCLEAWTGRKVEITVHSVLKGSREDDDEQGQWSE